MAHDESHLRSPPRGFAFTPLMLALIGLSLASYSSAPEAVAQGDPASPPHDQRPFLDFNQAPAATAAGYSVAAEPYLLRAADSIRIIARAPEAAKIVFVNNLGLYAGRAVVPTRSENFLTLTETGNAAASVTMEFAAGVESVSFRIPRLFAATQSGVTFPAWTATALGADGTVLSTHSEAMRRRFGDIPEEDVTLVAPGFAPIKCLRFDSDPRLNGVPFAGFSAVLIESLAFRAAGAPDHPVRATPPRREAPVTGCAPPAQ
jgi:hypothetical protein